MKRNKLFLSILVLCILYAVGLFGTVFFALDLIPLTALNLLISALILFANHSKVDGRLLLFAGIVFVSGWVIEWVGVETGRVFGQYFYGNNLGFKLFDIPLIIGLNWLLLCYCSAVVAVKILAKLAAFNTLYNSVFLGALLMLLVDVFIERVAPSCDFWYWKNQVIPIQNYVAWFAFGIAFNVLFHYLKMTTDNKVAPWLYGLMLLFFIGLNALG